MKRRIRAPVAEQGGQAVAPDPATWREQQMIGGQAQQPAAPPLSEQSDDPLGDAIATIAAEREREALCPICSGVAERPDVPGCKGCSECDYTGTRAAYEAEQRRTAEGFAALAEEEREQAEWLESELDATEDALREIGMHDHADRVHDAISRLRDSRPVRAAAAPAPQAQGSDGFAGRLAQVAEYLWLHFATGAEVWDDLTARRREGWMEHARNVAALLSPAAATEEG